MRTWQENMKMRAKIVAQIRAHFDAQGFIEVDTPVALKEIAPERHLHAPRVALPHAHRADATPSIPSQASLSGRFLQTSPELPMKRLLACGLEKIYQIAPVFRDGDLSPLHRPEFRLLEWYRKDASWLQLMHDCESLFGGICKALKLPMYVQRQGRTLDLTPPFMRLSVDEAFVQSLGFSLLKAQTAPQLAAALTQAGVYIQTDDSWHDMFHRAMVGRIEPFLVTQTQPVFLTHYPISEASLARPCPTDPRVAERVELWLGDVELANGFGELTCRPSQTQRFIEEEKLRQQDGWSPYPQQKAFLEALDHIDEACGIALGLERLILLLLGADTLDEVLSLPWHST